MLIRKLHNNVFDVFLGKGFDNWTRVKRGHWGVSTIAGQRLPKAKLKHLALVLERF